MLKNFRNGFIRIVKQTTCKLTCLGLLFAFMLPAVVSAQYPVQVTPQLLAPYTVHLSEYYNVNNPKLNLTLTNQDLQRPQISVRLKMSIKGQGVNLSTKINAFIPPIILSSGIPQRLSGTDLAPYFNPDNLEFTGGMSKSEYIQSGKLKEGYYEFCFEAVEATTGIDASRKECAQAWISYTDPPLLNLPRNTTVIELNTVPNIVFTWTPRHLNSPNSAFNTEYVFQIVEIWDNAVNPMAAFQSAQPLYQTTTSSTTLFYGPGQPPLLPGKRYAWRIQATPKPGVTEADIFKNNGFSEIFWFTLIEKCNPPLGLNSTIINGNAMISWQSLPINSYKVEYKENIPGTAWTSIVANANSHTFSGLAEGKQYTFRVGGFCKTGGLASYSDPQIFNIPVKPPVNSAEANSAKGSIKWAYHKSADAPTGAVKPLLYANKPTEASTNKTVNNDVANQAYSLAGADVKLMGKRAVGSSSQTVTLGSGKTGNDGSYKINLLGQPLTGLTETWVEVSHNSQLFFTKKRTVNLVKTNLGYEFGNDSLLVRSVEFTPGIFSKDNVATTDLAIEVLLLKSTWLKYGFMADAGLGKLADVVKFNNQDYIIVSKLTNGNAYNKLIQNLNNTENYVVRILHKNVPAGYFSLASMTTSPSTSLVILNTVKAFELSTTTQIEGVASSNTVVRRDVRISAVIISSDILGANTTQLNFETTTDANGRYKLTLPLLKDGAKINIQAVDRTIRIDPFINNIVKGNSNSITQNFELLNPIVHIIGRLIDSKGVAISNALIKIDGETQTAKTNSLGFYSIKASIAGSKTLRFVMDNYEEATKTINTSLIRVELANPIKVANWETKVKALTASVNPAVKTPEVLNIGTGLNWTTVFTNYFAPTESLQEVIYNGNQTLNKLPGTVDMNVTLNGKKVKAKIAIVNLADDVIPANQNYIKTLQEGKYNYSITSIENDSTFLPFFGEVVIEANKTKQVSIILKSGARISGKVLNKTNSNPVDSAEVIVKGLPYKTISAKDGSYNFIVPRNESIVISTSRSAFDTKDTTLTVKQNAGSVNISLVKRAIANIKSISGFPVIIDKQEENGGDNFKVSGKLILGENDIFKPNASNNKLTFKDIHVQVNRDSLTAVAIYDINFEEAVIKATAFFAPVEITGFPQIQLRALKDGTTGQFTYKNGVIGGERIKLLVGDVANAAKLPINLSNASLILKDSALSKQNKEQLIKGQKEFQYAFTPANFKINALRKSQSFGLEFKNSAVASFDAKLIKGSLGPANIDLVPIYINKDEAELKEDGLTLSGKIQFPRIVGMKMIDSGRVTITKFQIGKSFEIAELTVDISKIKPLKIGIQKIRAEVTSVSLFGIGTPNFGVGVGGFAFMKKPTTGAKTNDTLFIKEFTIINKEDGLTAAGKFAFGAKGFSIRSLVFNTGENQSLGFSYNRADKSFTFEASGTLSFDSTRTSKSSASSSSGISSAMKKILPIEIQTFQLKTKDWSFFLAAKANIKIDLKVAKINVEKIVVSVGKNDMDVNAINAALVSGTSLGSSNGTGGPDDEVDESTTGWAFGIVGGVALDVKSIKADASASLLVTNVNDKVNVIVNEIGLKIDAPSFNLDAKAKMSFSGDRRGFEAEAKIITKGNKQEFQAGFKYYSLSDGANSGIELGAKLKASVKIVTGPVLWHSLGGGFDFNTLQQTYQFWLEGDVSPAGTPKEAAYMAAKLDVLFDIKNCGAAPVITGSGTFYIKEQNWGTVTAKLDFCKSLTLITIASKIPSYPGVEMTANGVFYGMTEMVSGTPKGSLYVGVNVNVDVLNGLMKGNAFFATGVNYRDNHPNSPAEIKKDWSNIAAEAKDDNGNTLNGVFLKGTILIPGKKGDYGISVAGIPLAGFAYDFGATGSMMMYYKYISNTLRLEAKAAAFANAKVSVLGFSLNGNANANINIAGGYNGSWYANGSGSLSLAIANGSGTGLGCNSSKLTWSDCCCVNIGYPCGAYWWGVRWCNKSVCIPVPNYAFKVCKSLSASFDYKQGKPLALSIN